MITGKYKKRLNTVFLLIFTLLIVLFISSIFIIVIDKQARTYNGTMAYASKSILSNGQIKFEAMNSALQLVQESEEMLGWTESDSTELFYLGAVKVQEKIRKVSTKVKGNFRIAATFNDDESFVITPYSSESKDYFYYENLGISEAKVREITNHFTYNDKYLVFTINHKDEFPELCYITKKRYRSKEVLYFTLIDTKSFISNGKVYDWYLCNDEGIFVSNNGATIEPSDMYRAFQKSGLAESFKYDNRNIYVQPFYNINWTLLFSYDTNEMNYSNIIAYFAVIGVLMLLLAFYLSKVITNRLYKPLNDIISDHLEDLPDSKIDEFEVLKDNSLKIKSINNKLKLALEEKNNLLVQRLNREMLLGIKVNEKLYEGYLLDETNYCVAVLEFMNNPFNDSDEQVFICKNEILAFTQKLSDLRYANIDSHTCAFIIQCHDIEFAKSKMHHLLEELQIDYDIRIAISNMVFGTSNIKHAFAESIKILEYKFLFNERVILTMEQINELKRNDYFYPISLENKLIHSVLNGEIKALEIFNEVIDENNTNESLSPAAFKNLVFALISTISRIMQELKVDSKLLFSKDDDFITLSEQWNHKDIIPRLRGLVEELLLHVNNNKKVNENSIAEDMLAYIHRNYSENIMLVDLAQQMNISEKYCSILFKKVVGINFKNYLNSYRIEKAKECIHENADVKISKLGKMVGFNSSNTFIRVFTKYTGLTPKAYADEFKKNAIEDK